MNRTVSDREAIQRRVEGIIAQYITGSPPTAMYDLGVGTKSEWHVLSRRYPDMKLFGCEPHEATYQSIVKDFPGLLAPVAIGRSEGKAQLGMMPRLIPGGDPKNRPRTPTLLPVQGTTGNWQVDVWTLDQFDQWAGCPDRILLWADIDGSELAAMDGGRGLLVSGRVRWLNLELCITEPPCPEWPTASQVIDRMAQWGYRLARTYNNQQTHCDGIFIHSDEPIIDYEVRLKGLPDGWLTTDEARLLYQSASKTSGPILEVGSYRGRSTVLLARLGRTVYSVDSHSGRWSGEHRTRLLEAIKNLTNVTAFHSRVEDWKPRPCGFAYLDGDHTYEGTLAQIKTAIQCGCKVIAAHDVNDGGGGLEVKKALIEQLGDWDARVNRLAVWVVKEK